MYMGCTKRKSNRNSRNDKAVTKIEVGNSDIIKRKI